ncbi:vomeronasal type-2 receptor 26-like isoform X2 [Ranitomeya imitator]|uniref:vomeronasal type-2 receptor 26-like isoform X2 n=1 Tax=Ranitomeya imitator TaxID=111125 RepID=UPI0037E877DA
MIFFKILWHLVQYYFTTALYSNGRRCALDSADQTAMLWSGDIMVGAVLALHVEKVNTKITYQEKPGPFICRNFQLDKFLQLQIIKYTMKEINDNPNILPNMTLGFQVYDSCRVLQRELEGTLWMITGEKGAIPNYQCQRRNRLAAFIGYTTSTFSILMAHILKVIRYPQAPVSRCSESCPPGSRKTSIPGQPSCCFKCVPCSQGEISNGTDATDCSKCPWNKWPSDERDRCLQKPIEYLSYEETLGITLASTSIASSFVPIAILGLLICNKTTPIVRANNYTISCLLLICLSLCFLCSLEFIGYPERLKCLLHEMAFGLIFALCVSCILAKTILVMIAFRATKPNSDLQRWTSPQVSYLVICVGTVIQIVICIMWLIFSPPFPEYNLKAKSGVLIIECNRGSSTAYWLTLGYLSFLALTSCLVAFLARQLPDRFNEAKFITFSMLAFLTVWVSFIPASLSTSGKYTVAMEIFAIMASSWAILCCMFFPKCYVILFQPQVNSRKHLFTKRTMPNLT